VADLLFEIGGEEIPAKMLARALAELPELARARLTEARLGFRSIRALGTPRRLALVVSGLDARQPDLRERVVGPPASAAFGADGKPTKAAIGFAHKNGVDPSTLEKADVEGKKGQYVVASRFVEGKPAVEVLPGLLAQLIPAIPWPKSMRWGWGEHTFVRPVHWLVALLGGEVLPLTWAGIAAGRTSRGHRFLAPDPIQIADAAGYESALRAAQVVVDPEERRTLVVAELARVERETGTRIRPDDALVAEVTNLVEYPVAIAGDFEPGFLEVPEEIIVTAMRNHQRYFAVEDKGGALAPRFVTIAGTVVRDVEVVRRGNQSVLASRLSDARFFFREDQKKPLAEHAVRLETVVFQAKLGPQASSIGHKVRRIEAMVAALAERVTVDADAAQLAARLCKADLATGVVGEFPELQGVMGMHYVRREHERDSKVSLIQGSPADARKRADLVATAVLEHYLPRGAGGALPTTVEGALVGIADRVDTLVGCFATGLEPSGSADPYGLRRAAIAILQILLDRGPGGAHHVAGSGWPIEVDTLIELGAHQFAGAVEVTDSDAGELLEFFRGRLRGLLVDEGLAAMDVEAALGAGFTDPCDARLRARDLGVVPAPAREVFKRIANILDDAHGKGEPISGDVKPALFAAEGNAEWRLWKAFEAVRDRVEAALAEQRYRDLFVLLVELQPTVASFFDKGGVMVMDPDPKLRENRLSLLTQILSPFARVADFRQLAVQS
jgi:glycyl-tRNA synthetase beta chain